MIDAALTGAGWVDLAASVTLAGGLVYGALVGEPSDAGLRALRTAAVVLALALGLQFVLTALRMNQVSQVRGARLVLDLLSARWGRLWALRCVGLAVLGSQRRRGVVLAVPWLLLRSFQGHAGAHGTVTALIDGLHLVAAAAWIGSLVQLAVTPPPVPVAVARRMRALATMALAVLIPAGTYGATVHVQRLQMLTGSAYGRVLLVKLGLAAVLVSLGALNHFRHVPAMAAGDPRAAGRLSRAVRSEIILATAVLLVTALLGVLPMPHVHAG